MLTVSYAEIIYVLKVICIYILIPYLIGNLIAFNNQLSKYSYMPYVDDYAHNEMRWTVIFTFIIWDVVALLVSNYVRFV